jgi:GNAT superfamily N-acetyltransferase
VAITQRNYSNQAGMTEDYFKVRNFFVNLEYAEFTYARWDWMITHSYLDKDAIGRIGVWEDGGEVVGVATYDTMIGSSYCLALPGYEHLKKEMALYAKENLSNEGQCGIIIADADHHFQNIAASLGLVASINKENDAIFYPEQTLTDYELPAGFRITSMKDTYDAYQYRLVLWKGFNHELNGEGELIFSEEVRKNVDDEMLRPNLDLNLKIAVVSPEGNFVSFCGMWYEPKAKFALVEPVATVPEYRRKGLGRAAVYEGIKRVSRLGATKVLVGSSQQFYYSIGFRPYATASEWVQP